MDEVSAVRQLEDGSLTHTHTHSWTNMKTPLSRSALIP